MQQFERVSFRKGFIRKNRNQFLKKASKGSVRDYKPSILGHENYSHTLLKQFTMTPVIKHHFRLKQLLRIMVEF